MSQTIIPFGDGRVGIKFSIAVAYQVVTSTFWGRNFMSSDGSKPLHRVIDLEQGQGFDQVRIDKWNQLSEPPVTGDANAVGKEEKLAGTYMPMWINQARKPVSVGGRMSQKRIAEDLREIGKNASSIFWARWFDEEFFVYAAGRRGTATKNWLHKTSWDFSGFANNALSVPHANNIFYPIGISAQTAIVAANSLTVKQLDYYSYLLADMENPPQPLIIEGEEMYMFIMSEYDAYALKAGLGSDALGEMRQLQKYGKTEKDMPWMGLLGRWGNFLLFKHNKVVRTYDATYNNGAGGVVNDCLIVGAQALALAHGDAGNGMHFGWYEDTKNYGNDKVVVTDTMFGVQRVDFETTPGTASTKAPQGLVVCRTFGGATAI